MTSEKTTVARSGNLFNRFAVKQGALKARLIRETSLPISLIKYFFCCLFSIFSAIFLFLGMAKLWISGFIVGLFICAAFVLYAAAEFFVSDRGHSIKHSFRLYDVAAEEWVLASIQAGLISQSQQKSQLYSMHNVLGGLSVSIQWFPRMRQVAQSIQISFLDDVDADVCCRLVASVADIIEKRRQLDLSNRR